MQVIKKLLVWSSIALFAGSSWAQVQQAKGKATVSYQGWSASADDKARATSAAQLKAVEFYYAEAGRPRPRTSMRFATKFLAAPDRYILDTTVLAEEENKDKKQYTVAVRVALNVANLRNAVKSNSAVVAGTAARSPLAFMFVSRQVDSTRSFDDRVYKRVDQKADVKGNVQVSEKGSEGSPVAARSRPMRPHRLR
jgi:hypothetical protein